MDHKATERPLPALITCKFLKDLLNSKPSDLVILDTSSHPPYTGRDAKAEYDQQHIPGAVFFNTDKCADKNVSLPNMAPPAEEFESHVGQLGIGNETQVIVYDNSSQAPMYQAQRVWWLFRLFGHIKVCALEGGLPNWMAAGGELSNLLPDIKPKTFKASFRHELIKHYDDIQRNIKSGEFSLVDTRPANRFEGKAPEPKPGMKSGCIKGSKNIPITAMMNPEDRTMKSKAELLKIFEEAGVDINKPIVGTCATAMTACTVALAAHLCGKEDVAIYDGSWAEWYNMAPAELKENVPSD